MTAEVRKTETATRPEIIRSPTNLQEVAFLIENPNGSVNQDHISLAEELFLMAAIVRGDKVRVKLITEFTNGLLRGETPSVFINAHPEESQLDLTDLTDHRAVSKFGFSPLKNTNFYEESEDDEINLIRQYFNDTRHKLLTPEEEWEIGVRILKGDEEAIETLVYMNFRYVISIAARFKNKGLPFIDLIQQGNIGLIEAARSFDCREARFPTYAKWLIRREIVRGIIYQGRAIRVPENIFYLKMKMWKAREKAEQNYGSNPTPNQIAEHSNNELTAQQVVNLIRWNRKIVGLDDPVGDDKNYTRGEKIPSQNRFVEEEIDQLTLEHIIKECLGGLTSDQAKIVCLCYGISTDDTDALYLNHFDEIKRESPNRKSKKSKKKIDLSFAEVGRILGISRERVRQLHDIALNKLRVDEDFIVAIQDYY